MNSLDLTSSYFRHVFRHRSISQINNFDRFFASLGHSAKNYGFSNSRAGALGSYAAGAAAFDCWYRGKFLGDIVFRECPGHPEDHEFYEIYLWIKERLEFKACEELKLKVQGKLTKDHKIRLKTFTVQVFTSVFQAMKIQEEKEQGLLREFANLARKGDVCENLSALRADLERILNTRNKESENGSIRAKKEKTAVKVKEDASE